MAMKTWANILLGIWLVLKGLVALGGVRVPGGGAALALLGIVAGVLFLLADREERLLQRLGTVLLGVWLLATGLLPLLHLNFAGSGVVLAVLAVVAGALILLRH
jgi:hypothetical protein